ncbi:DNA polymerase III subunit beta [Planctomycetota bacterium]
MKIHVNRQVLYEAVQIVNGILPTRSPKPILQNLKLIVSAEKRCLLATDLEIGISFNLDSVEVMEEGEVLIPARELSEILRENQDERIHIESDNNNVIISTDRSEFKMLSEETSEFPEIPSFDEPNSFKLPADVMLKLISRVTFAVASEPTRYAINGVLMDLNKSIITMVSTDGKRLAFAKDTIENKDKITLNVIASTKGLNFISKIIDDSNEIRIQSANNQLIFNTPRATLVTLMVEGHFPNYEEVIPKHLSEQSEIDRRQLESNLRQARLMTTDESKAVRLHFTDNCLTITSRAPEKGESKIEMDVKYNGKEMEVGFDPRYLLDGLKVVASKNAEIQFKDANNPAMLVEGKDFIYVIMPISLG